MEIVPIDAIPHPAQESYPVGNAEPAEREPETQVEAAPPGESGKGTVVDEYA